MALFCTRYRPPKSNKKDTRPVAYITVACHASTHLALAVAALPHHLRRHLLALHLLALGCVSPVGSLRICGGGRVPGTASGTPSEKNKTESRLEKLEPCASVTTPFSDPTIQQERTGHTTWATRISTLPPQHGKQNRTAVYVPAVRLVICIVAVDTCRADAGLGLSCVAVRRKPVTGHVTCSARKQ
jgi:hypothetical protein